MTPPRLLLLLALSLGTLCLPSSAALAQSGKITALGRLEPGGGVIRVAGPSLPAVVITELLVEEGDVLEAGQAIARLDTYARHRATVEAMRARLEGAEQELERSKKLQASRATAIATFDEATTNVKVARAELAAAQADLALSEVKAPNAGRVLVVHARAGERVGPEGILEMGNTGQMYAVAEVYEADIGRVKTGQRATITSPALEAPLSGEVERLGMLVAKMDVLDTDPVARTDARVVEVDIRLDQEQDVGQLTYLQVTVEITP